MTDLLPRRPRLLPVPDPNPPYDPYDRPWSFPDQRRRRHRQGVLALEFHLPSGVPARPCASGPARAGLPTPARWGRMLAEAFADALNGTRPVDQLQLWVTRSVRRHLLVAIRSAATPGSAGYGVRAVHAQCPAPGVVEVAATLHGRVHARALAFRLEERGGQWVCTALEVGLLAGPR